MSTRGSPCEVRVAARKLGTSVALQEPPRTDRERETSGGASWHHSHEFEAVDGGTLMTDTVDYRLPLGPLGGLAHLLFVRRSLRKIFDFRAAQLRELFPAAPADRPQA